MFAEGEEAEEGVGGGLRADETLGADDVIGLTAPEVSTTTFLAGADDGVNFDEWSTEYSSPRFLFKLDSCISISGTSFPCGIEDAFDLIGVVCVGRGTDDVAVVVVAAERVEEG